MTKLLEDAFSKVKSLPESEQDLIAHLVLEHVESEKCWDELFAKSPEKLAKFADQVWAAHEAGNSEILDVDKL